MKQSNIQPHGFDNLVGKSLTKEAAQQMMKLHFNKLKYEVRQHELELRLNALKKQIEADERIIQLKQLKKELKETKNAMRTATDMYLGSVATGLINFMPGKSLDEKLFAIDEAAKNKDGIKQLEESNV